MAGTTFEATPDPQAAGGAFAGTTTGVGPALYGVPSLLASLVVDIGKTKSTYDQTSGGWKGTGQEPDMVSLDRAVKHVYDMDPGDLSNIQKQMWDGGVWYSPTTYKDGYVAGSVTSGDDTDNAWNNVVMTSAKSGKPIAQVLQDAIDRTNQAGGLAGIGKKVGAAASSSGPVAKVDLYHYGNAIARTLIGREMSPDQMNNFITQYQAADAAGKAGTPENAAESFLQSSDPGEVGAQRMVDAADQLMQMVGAVPKVSLTQGPAH